MTELHHTSPEFTKSTRESPFVVTGKNFMCFVPRPELERLLEKR